MQFKMSSFRLVSIVLLALSFITLGFAQHQGHQMPKPTASPKPAASLASSVTPSPSPSPAGTQPHRHTPGMQMPTASPSPEQKMSMPMPMASPSPSSTGQMEGMHGMEPMDMGPLVVMEGNDMGIRVGSNETNVMSMGAMGSGNAWQPSSGPMHVHHWTKGDWLLMFHYNLIAAVNRRTAP